MTENEYIKTTTLTQLRAIKELLREVESTWQSSGLNYIGITQTIRWVNDEVRRLFVEVEISP